MAGTSLRKAREANKRIKKNFVEGRNIEKTLKKKKTTKAKVDFLSGLGKRKRK